MPRSPKHRCTRSCLPGLIAAAFFLPACQAPKTTGEAAGMGVSMGLGAAIDMATVPGASLLMMPVTDEIGDKVGQQIDDAERARKRQRLQRRQDARKRDHAQYSRLRQRSAEKYQRLHEQ